MSFRDLLLPSRRNAYRPALLSKDTLTLLFAVTLLCEGFLWGGLAAGNLGGASLSAAAVQAGGQSYLQQALNIALLDPVNVELVASPAHSDYPLVVEE